jgi:Deoxyribonuclease NucA/NucB
MPPTFEVDWNKHPHLADNIWQALKAGHPSTLTRCDIATNKANRSVVMGYEVDTRDGRQRFRVPTTNPLDRDEYPFACTLEGGGGAWIGHVHFSQNRSGGGLLNHFFKSNGIEAYPNPNSRFEVKVLNHPLDVKS